MNSGKSTLLFVDDEPNFLNGLRRILHDLRDQWELHFVTSADEAVAFVREHDTDVVVSDVNMPGKNGFDLLKTMKSDEATRDIPFLMLTGSAELNHKRLALELGATDLLNKPVVREDLQARLVNALRLKSFHDDLKQQNATLEAKVRRRTAALEHSRLDIMWRLAKAGEYRDEETGNHIMRVGSFCRLLGQELGQPASFIDLILLASPLHDIGKIGIPDAILLKPGKLTDEEWVTMRRHCAIGYEILTLEPRGMNIFLEWLGAPPQSMEHENPLVTMAASIALNHHEKWDGSGYPNRKKGEDIPLEARITAMADVYDALRSDRPYKKAFNIEESMTIIRQGTGKHFDPQLVEAFERIQPRVEEIREQFSDHIA